MHHKEIAIIAEHVGKAFALYEPYIGGRKKLEQIFLSPFVSLFKSSDKEISTNEGGQCALKDISFTLRKGETLGIVGANGSGKSVLLKIISQVTFPTSGRLMVKGNVVSLLELGLSLHPQLTGRENVMILGSLFGMSYKEIRRKFDDIHEMSEMGSFIEKPVKFYSSGMQSKLSLAIALNCDPDILILDEALSVSDREFKARCVEFLKKRSLTGKTTLMVSHDNNIIQDLCTKILWIDSGNMIEFGPLNEVFTSYQKDQKTSYY